MAATINAQRSGLKSLLGVTGEYEEDFNNAPVNRTVFVAASSPANAPISGMLRGFLTTKKLYSYILQTYTECGTSINHSNETYQRTKSGDTWSDWVRVDNFGCSTPSALASLLGVPNGGYDVFDINGTQMYGEMFVWNYLNLFLHWDTFNNKVIAIYARLTIVENASWTMVSLT